MARQSLDQSCSTASPQIREKSSVRILWEPNPCPGDPNNVAEKLINPDLFMRKYHSRKRTCKVKRHLLKFIRFAGVYAITEAFIQAYQKLVGFEHYALIEWTLAVIYFSVSGWFIWRLVTGIRDGDLLEEE